MKLNTDTRIVDDLHSEISELKRQLAAAVEALKKLRMEIPVDAEIPLTKNEQIICIQAQNRIIDIALAKLEEGK